MWTGELGWEGGGVRVTHSGGGCLCGGDEDAAVSDGLSRNLTLCSQRDQMMGSDSDTNHSRLPSYPKGGGV